MPQKAQKPKRGCTIITIYGEALTSNEVFERIQGEKGSTNAPPSKKKRRHSPPPEDDETASSPKAVDGGDGDSHDEGIY